MLNKKHAIHVFAPIILFLPILVWIIDLRQDEMPYLDQISRDFIALSGTDVYTFFGWMTELGSRSFVLPFTIIMMAVIGFLFKHVIPSLIFGLGTLSSHLLNNFIKNILDRDRPSISALLNAEGFSFPSGHAMTSLVCYGILAYLLSAKFSTKRNWIYLFFGILILLIGISRYFLNVHYLTDVIAGFYFGYLCLLLLLFIYKKWVSSKNSSFD